MLSVQINETWHKEREDLEVLDAISEKCDCLEFVLGLI